MNILKGGYPVSDKPIMLLNKKLKEVLEMKALKLTELSELSGVSLSTLHGWINGAEPKTIAQLKKVSEALNVSLDYLCFGSDELTILESINNELSIGEYEIVLRKIKKGNQL